MKRGNLLIRASLPLLMLFTGNALAGDLFVTDCGTVIDEPGYYKVANDILDCPEGGIIILSSDVTLDLKGHTISCATNDELLGGVVVWGSESALVSNVTVRNGEVTNCNDGVLLLMAEDSVVTKISSHGNRATGGAYGTGFTVWLSRNNVLMNNHAYGNDLQGIGSWSSGGNQFLHNLVTGNGDCGIMVEDERYSRLQANQAHENVLGICIGPYATDNLLRNNFANDNYWQGIAAYGLLWDGYLWYDIPVGNTFRLNSTIGNLGGDIGEFYYDVITEDLVIHPEGTCMNTWEKNKFDTGLGPDGCFDHRGNKQ